MAEVNVDNGALFLGGNSVKPATLTVPAGAERTIPAGTYVTMLTADGTKVALHTAQPNTDIDGVLREDLLVAADAGDVDYAVNRCFTGDLDDYKLEVANEDVVTTDIPGTNAKSYEMQMETKGFRLINSKCVTV